MIKLELNPPRQQLVQFGWISLFGFPAIGAVAFWQLGASETLPACNAVSEDARSASVESPASAGTLPPR